MTDLFEAPAHHSYSQINSIKTCGHRFYLEKVHKVQGRPSWASVGGSAVHAATEDYDLREFGLPVSLDPSDFVPYLEREIADQVERTGYSESEFRASGRASREWPNKENRAWWEANGPVMVNRWISWRQVSPWEIWLTPDARPAVELEVNATFAEGEMVKAVIDRVMHNPATGELAVVDIKSGHIPNGGEQLGQYSASLAKVFGWDQGPRWGFYWDARKGGTSEAHDLTRWPLAYFDYAYTALSGRKKNKDMYLPVVSNLCNGCSVRDYCRYVGGPKADEIPLPWEEKK